MAAFSFDYCGFLSYFHFLVSSQIRSYDLFDILHSSCDLTGCGAKLSTNTGESVGSKHSLLSADILYKQEYLYLSTEVRYKFVKIRIEIKLQFEI